MSDKTKGFLWGMFVWVAMSLAAQYTFFRDVDNSTFIWIFLCGAITADVVRSFRGSIDGTENKDER